jgi:hypothetical protein
MLTGCGVDRVYPDLLHLAYTAAVSIILGAWLHYFKKLEMSMADTNCGGRNI